MTATRCAPRRARSRFCDAVPHDARPQAGELIRGIAAGEHVERRRKVSSERSAKFAQRRTSARRSSTSHSSTAVAATICWARTSSGLRVALSSTRPSRIRSHHDGGLEEIAAELGEDPAGARFTDLVAGAADALDAARHRTGDSTSTTRSTAPMSMPSSRLLVATMPRRWPAFSSSSAARRCSRDERAVVGAHELLAGEFVEARGEPLGGAAAFTKTSVVRWARTSSSSRGCSGARCSCGFGVVEPEASAFGPTRAESRADRSCRRPGR